MEADLPELGSPQGWIEPALEQIAVAFRIPLAVRENEIMVAFGTLESPNSKGVKEPGGKLTVRRESFDIGTEIHPLVNCPRTRTIDDLQSMSPYSKPNRENALICFP